MSAALTFNPTGRAKPVQIELRQFGPEFRVSAEWFVGQSIRPRPAVLICPPIGVEHLSCAPALNTLGCELALRGCDVLLMSYAGLGQSPVPLEAQRLDDWLQDIRLAARHLQDLTHQDTIDVIGLRLGAPLSQLAQLPSVHRTSLWEPVMSGLEFMKRLRLAQTPNGGSELLPGCHLHPWMVRDLTHVLMATHAESFTEQTRLLRPSNGSSNADYLAPLEHHTLADHQIISTQVNIDWSPEALHTQSRSLSAALTPAINWLLQRHGRATINLAEAV